MKKRKKNLRIVGHETTKQLKEDIQALIRNIVIIRDGGCILRHYPEAGRCGGFRKDGQLILQAEHLITRSNSATYGDTRNIVCLCVYHHKFFKPQRSRIYWDLVEKHVGPKIWSWIKLMEADKKAYKVDWKLTKFALENELREIKNNDEVSFTCTDDF